MVQCRLAAEGLNGMNTEYTLYFVYSTLHVNARLQYMYAYVCATHCVLC